MEPIKFKVLFLPVSVNRMYAINHYNRSVYLTKEAQHFKMAIKLACPPVKFDSAQPKIRIEMWYHSPAWVCKNGKFKKRDIQNMDKMLIDAISEKLGVDDSHVWHTEGTKVLSTEEYTEISIGEMI